MAFLQHGRFHVSGDRIGPTVPLEASQDLQQEQIELEYPQHMGTATSSHCSKYTPAGADPPQHWGPHPPGTRAGPYPHIDLVTNQESVNAQSYADEARSRQALKGFTPDTSTACPVATTRSKRAWTWSTRAWRARWGHPVVALYYDENGTPSLVSLWDREFTRAAAYRVLSTYVQDQMVQLTFRHLTINAGLRLDVNRASVPVQGTCNSRRRRSLPDSAWRGMSERDIAA